jgi:hypothetical protein
MSQEKKEALDTMIRAVAENMKPFEGSADERYVRRVLEDLQIMRDPPPLPKSTRQVGKEGIQLLKDVRNTTRLGLAAAKRICEEAEWDRGRAMEAVRERGER